MSKTLTEQWKNGKLKDGSFYIERFGQYMMAHCIGRVLYLENHDVIWSPYTVKIIAPVPSYDEVKEMSQKIERLEFDNEALEMAHNEGKEINDELVSKNDELVQKIHILNEQNTKNYNELCEEIKKNNILEKRLEIATKALKEYADRTNWIEGNFMCVYDGKCFADEESADKALKEMEGVK